MGLSKEQKRLMAELSAAIASLRNPASNPYQQYLGNEALAGAEYFKKGDFSTLPKGMFFDFQMPVEQLKQYKKLANVNQGGTFALAQGGNGGKSRAQQLQSQYLGDRFARDAAQNYQDNIARAADRVKGGLAQAAGERSSNQQAIISALGNMYQLQPEKKGFNWGGILGGIGGALAAI